MHIIRGIPNLRGFVDAGELSTIRRLRLEPQQRKSGSIKFQRLSLLVMMI